MLNDPAMERIPIKPRVYAAIDTGYYTLSDEELKYIANILTVYLYDSNSRTFCCESTPSYAMLYLYTTIEWADTDLPEAMREKLYDKFCENDGDDTYIHCSSLDRLERINPTGIPQLLHVAEDVEVSEDESRTEAMEALHEYYRCNHAV